MNYSTQLNYSEILRDLQGFDEWLGSLRIPVRSMDRAHYAIQKLQRAHRAFVDGTDHAAGVSKSDYLFALTEALELRDVFCAFRDYSQPAELRGRLIRALSGPPLPEAETRKNRDGRNVMFELALGAEWVLCGGKIELIEPDLALRMPSRSYLVACKRPDSEHGIRAAVKDAASQLQRVLPSTGTDHFGIVAVSLSRILNPGKAFFGGTYAQLSALVNGLMGIHRSDWRTTDFHLRNIAVLFYAQTPADWGDGLYRMSAIRVVESFGEHNEHHGNLESDLNELYARRDASECER